MSKPALDRPTYDALVVAFREHGRNILHVSRAVGVSRGVARKAYDTGYTTLPWARPIKDVLAEEQQRARALAGGYVDAVNAAAAKTQAEEAAKAALDAANYRALEALGVRAALEVGNDLWKAFRSLSAAFPVFCEKLAEQLTSVDIDPDEAAKLLRDVVAAGKDLTKLYREGMEMERMHLGEPLASVDHVHRMSEEDAVADLQLAARAAKRLEGRLRIVPKPEEDAPGAG